MLYQGRYLVSPISLSRNGQSGIRPLLGQFGESSEQIRIVFLSDESACCEPEEVVLFNAERSAVLLTMAVCIKSFDINAIGYDVCVGGTCSTDAQ